MPAFPALLQEMSNARLEEGQTASYNGGTQRGAGAFRRIETLATAGIELAEPVRRAQSIVPIENIQTCKRADMTRQRP